MATSTKEQDLGLIERVNSLVRRARLAAAVFTQYTQEDVDRIVKAMTIAAIEAVEDLAIAAHEETRMGLIEDKVLKNFVASEFHYHQIKDKKTVGIIRQFPEDNMVEVAEPMGVILALSPVTNPTSTIIFKSIAAAKTRNTIIFSPHLMAADSSNKTARILYEAGVAAGAPKGFISWVEKSPRLRRETELMMVHPEVDLIFATGGTQMVKAAYSSGKPALGVGAGNTPVYITSSASPQSAAMDVVISKTFDNGTECPSEQTLIIDAEIAEALLFQFKRMNCYVCNQDEVEKVGAVVIDPRTGGMNYKLVGQSADTIAKAAGIDVPPYTKIILCPLEGDLRYHKLAVEKLMPVLGYVVVDSVDEGINRALDINYAGGTGHTAGIFTEDDSVLERFSNAINAGRIIVNSPTSIGGLGGVYNNLNTTLSFGCGTGGGNITTDNVGIKNLINYKRVPKRTNFTLTFQSSRRARLQNEDICHK
jgi:acetaldehyde dehydrogenase/alcohol dehydrogenase